MFTRSWRAAVALVVALAAGTALLVGAPADADSIEVLPAGFGAIAVDPVTANVYVSSPAGDAVTVLDRDARVVHTIGGVDGAGEMLVDGDRLYVVAADAGRVEAYDTTTFAPVAIYGDGMLDSPGPLVKAAGRLWTSSGACHQHKTQLASIDLTTGVTAVHPWIVATNPVTVTPSFAYCFGLAADPALGDQLLAFSTHLSPASVGRIDISRGAPVVTHLVRTDAANAKQLAVLPGGDEFVMAAGSPYYVQEYRTATLGTDDRYVTGHYPNAVTISTVAGRAVLAAGRSSTYEADVDLFDVGSQPAPPLLTRDLAAFSELQDRGLAFSPDGSRLYAVFKGQAGTNPYLAVIETAGNSLAPTEALVDAPSPVTDGQPVPVTVTVTSPSSPATSSTPAGTVDLFADGTLRSSAPLDTAGRATFSWTPAGTGVHELWARYRGSDAHAPTLSPTRYVRVGAPVTVMLTSSDNPSTAGAPVTITATLTSTSGSTPWGAVALFDGDTPIGYTWVDANGQATYSVAFDLGSHTLTASYEGDAFHGPSTSSPYVQVAERAKGRRVR